MPLNARPIHENNPQKALMRDGPQQTLA